MKKSLNFILALTTIFSAILFSFGCDSDDTNPVDSNNPLLGTWDLVSITSTLEGQQITITTDKIPVWIQLVPEIGMLPETITFNADNTYQLTYVNNNTENGTWSSNNNELTIQDNEGSTSSVFPYTVANNTATITISVYDEGETLTGELLYNKR